MKTFKTLIGAMMCLAATLVGVASATQPAFTVDIDITGDLDILVGETTTLTATWTTNNKDVTRYEWSVDGVGQGVQSFDGTSSGTFTFDFTPAAAGSYTITFRIWHHQQTDRDASESVVVVVTAPSFDFAGWRPPVTNDPPGGQGWNSGSIMPVKFLVVDAQDEPVIEGLHVTVRIGDSDPVTAVLDDPETGQWKAEITLVGEGWQDVVLDGNIDGVTPLEILIR
ncbi:MAG: hypothetical protein ACM3VT_16720 [Solirubrobacterales bacterium]